MCRFLIIKSSAPIHAGEILRKFARMAERSRAPDGDWQGDGWGVSWLDDKENWQSIKSINRVWHETYLFSTIPESRFFLAHARSASFAQHKNVLAYNQPFVRDPYSFVFNGLLKGVRFPSSVPGEIGSQKIWNLLIRLLSNHEERESLDILQALLEGKSRAVQALNIGLCNRKNFYVYCQYLEHPEYYHLQFFESSSLKIVCSEPLGGYDFQPVLVNKVLAF